MSPDEALPTSQGPEIFGVQESGLAIAVTGLVWRDELVVHIFFPDGSYRRDWPDRGLVGEFAVDRARNSEFWGTWRTENGDRIVTLFDGTERRFRAYGENFRDPDGKALARLVDGQDAAAFAGEWEREYSASSTPRISFSLDGRFSTRGGLIGLIADPNFVADWGGRMPGPLFDLSDSAGSYELTPFSLRLRRDDGLVVDLLRLAFSRRMRLGYTWFVPV